MTTVSWVDVVLVALLMVSVAFGIRQGLIRQAVLLISMYVSTALAASYHVQLAASLVDTFPTASVEMARSVAFISIALLLSVALTWLLWIAYRETKLPTMFVVDAVGGSALGIIIGVIAINLLLTVAWYSMATPWTDANEVKHFLQTGLTESALEEMFRSPMPLITATLRPWLPAGIPALLGS